MDSQNFRDKVVLITGGSTGIGFASAKLSRGKAPSWYCSRAAPRTCSAPPASLAPNLDLTGRRPESRDIQRLCAAIRERHGRLDALFANAGIAEFQLATEATAEHFDRVFDVNVRGAFFTVQAALPLMSQGGSIVFNTSIATSSARLERACMQPAKPHCVHSCARWPPSSCRAASE
jgi:NAD(P)-dependent dehydrogenase (short-subunit alcohol dehydrogenase family)